MGKPKGSGKKAVKAPEMPPQAVPAVESRTEIEKATSSPTIEPEKAEIAPQTFPNDRYIYSETEPPIVLKAGNPVPAGYSADRTKIKQFWLMDAQGKFTKG